jgi:hypothetical protein
MDDNNIPEKKRFQLPPKEAPDFYMENGLMVFTEAFHLKRGYCCQSGCRNCPYGFDKSKNKDDERDKSF